MHHDDLFLTALTHSSWAHEHGGTHNERLEFLGDAVLELCASDLLYHQVPDQREGVLSRMRQGLVNKETLAELSRQLGLDQAVRLGGGSSSEHLRQEAKLLSDVWEAMLGAVYLALGLEAAREIVRTQVLPTLSLEPPLRDPKTRLQEWTQRSQDGSVPQYQVLSRHGPDNDPLWTVAVVVAGRRVGQGSARKKKEAEQEAAADGLRTLGIGP